MVNDAGAAADRGITGYKVAVKLETSELPRRSASPEQRTPASEVHAIEHQAQESACHIARSDLFVLDYAWPADPSLPRCARCDQLVPAAAPGHPTGHSSTQR